MRPSRPAAAGAVAALAAALLAAILAACGAARTSSPPAPTAGIDLLTMAGPTCPVQRQGQTCERAISARVVVRNGAGTAVTTVQTGADGKARVPLPPGTYQVVPQSASAGMPRAPMPTTVTVVAGAFVTVRIDYDTGIR